MSTATLATRTRELRADCAKCCGLCCVGPAFDADQGFGFDKPAHQPCAHLRGDFRCSIHGERQSRGFPACVTFDCYGAGQRVTQQLFEGKSWQSAPELAVQMFNAYYRYRVLHELMALLELAIEKASSFDALWLRDRRELIDELCDSGAAVASTISIEALRKEVVSRVRDVLRGVQPGR